MKHDLKVPPQAPTSSAPTQQIHPSNFADPVNRRFELTSQEAVNRASSRIRRKEGVNELLINIKQIADKKGFDSSTVKSSE